MVGLTFAIGVLAAYVSLALARRLSAAQPDEGRGPWYGLGAITLGLGLWAMHFVGMMAFQLPQPVAYDVTHLLVSSVVSVGLAAAILSLAARPHLGPTALAAGSLAVGLGLGLMHFVGMGGFHADAVLRYQPIGVAVGLGLAVLAGIATLTAPERLRESNDPVLLARIGFALVAGLAFAAAHFILVAATQFVPGGQERPLPPGALVASPGLGMVVVGAALAILAVALLGALADRYLLARSAELAAIQAGERAVRATERRYQLVMENLRDYAVFSTDLDGTIQTWNPGAERLLGYSEEEALGRNGRMIFTPEEQARGDPEQEMQQAIETGRSEDERPHMRRDGTRFWASGVLISLRDETGSLVGFAKIIRDTTDRKLAEEERQAAAERMSTILESITDAFFALDRAWRFTYLNHQAEVLLDRTRPELLGRVIWDEFPWSVGTTFEREYRRAAATGQTVSFEEFYTPLGKWFEVRAFPSSEGLSVYFRDTTERREAEAALRQREDQLRQAQKMEAVGQLAGGIAHDFNNLLTAITGYASLLLRRLGEQDDRRADALEIRRAAERAGALTQQLLAFSRRQVSQPRPLSLNALLEDLSRMLRRLLGEQIEIVLELAPDLATIRADPGQVEQVIVNLAVNARDAMPEGGTLTIATGNLELDADQADRFAQTPPGRYVRLSVSDTGTGMDAETQARIFEPFFTTKAPGRGTGLGLSTVYGIVRQAGGSVSVRSTPGAGATFDILLPEAAGQPDVAIPAGDPAPETGTETVLLVEDEEAVRNLAARTLRDHGYRVLEAVDGTDALEVAAGDHRFDLLLTDVALPRLGGRALAEQLLRSRPELRVLYMSGYTTDPAVMTAADRGRFVQKPFSPEALLLRVRAVLNEPV